MIANILILNCLTNMHVGNGDVNYNIIDNEVERDPVTNYPTIHSSGVKGSLRQYFSADTKLVSKVKDIFGSSNGEKDFQQGKIKFLSADMLAIPMRTSSGIRPYELVTTQNAIERFDEMTGNLLFHDEKSIFHSLKDNSTNKCNVEGKQLENYVEFQNNDVIEKLYIMENKDFNNVALPILARNQLENGKSNNLWYEEVVSHKSIFFIPVLANDTEGNTMRDLIEGVDGKIIQFGGNATIGYGFCKVSLWTAKEVKR